MRSGWTLIAGFLVALFFAGPAVAQTNLVPAKARAKIDRVKTNEAPYVKIFVTFLNTRTLPVKPELISKADLTCSDVPVKTDVEISTFGDQETEFMDIAVIIPVSNRFSENEQEQIKAGVGEIVGQTREADRVVALFDQGVGIGPPGATLTDAGTAAEHIAGAVAQGPNAFLYSGLKKALKILTDKENADPDRKRVIIMVTDGFDSEAISPIDVANEMTSIYKLAKKENIQIFIVMYKPLFEDIVPLFEGLARKTGATFREASSPSDIVKMVKYTYGEVYGQLVLDFKYSDVKVGDICEFVVSLERKGSGKVIETKAFSEVEFTVVNTDWWGIALIAGIILGALIFLLIMFFIIRKIVRWRRGKKEQPVDPAAAAEAEAAEDPAAAEAAAAAAGEEPPPEQPQAPVPQRRGMGAPGGLYRPGGAPPAGGGGGGGGGAGAAKAGGAAAAGGGGAAAAAGGASKRSSRRKKKEGGKACDNCGRQMMPNWTECLFCKAGIGGAANK